MTDLNAIHQPVLLDECVGLVAPALAHGDAIVVDCTLGLAGHAIAFLKSSPGAHLIGIDRDEEALELATERMDQEGLSSRFIPVHAAFDDFDEVLESQGIEHVDAAFMDLGLSSLQIDETSRGFSYAHDAPLDMRMDTTQTLTAAEVLASYSLQRLTSIFREYGEERFSRPIARAIVESRESHPLQTSKDLNELVDATVPKSHRPAGNPAKRVFQALRIEVNGELEKLSQTLPQIATHLNMHGRIVVESYHSLEDRTVKRFMTDGTRVNVPRGLPIIPEEAQPYFKDLTHGAIKADDMQIEENPRSASVRLRAVELIRHIPENALKEYEEHGKERG
ncbi:MAG: 16S rRNA (cytosine(1402)-N(4))-methyltransferase RsmH [Bifidobacterium aquikefiri]|uniref:16S rRNA (cytosine(1402)-N(4))-methyltransferase RsmH n=1 Tax=Bifidobacterium aquikefiri TaxID=1653207 RepID=UPI0039ED8DB7